MRKLTQSAQVSQVRTEHNVALASEARAMERAGLKIFRLDLEDPAAFAIPAPSAIVADIAHNLLDAQRRSESAGMYGARTAVAQHFQDGGLTSAVPSDVYIGNGASDLILLTVQALLSGGNDEILLPRPGYSLWADAVILFGGRPVFYDCVEENHWLPDLEEIRSRVTDSTQAIVIINPHSPTGVVYQKELLQAVGKIAGERDIMLLADEVYEKVLFDGVNYISTAAAIDREVVCASFGSLSKAYRANGYRAGWMMVSGPAKLSASFRRSMDLLSSVRGGPGALQQNAIQTALGGYQSVSELTKTGGRLHEQRQLISSWIRGVEGLAAVEPQATFSRFVKLDLRELGFESDSQFATELLRAQRVLVTPGSNFRWDYGDHFRLVALSNAGELSRATDRISTFLDEWTY